MSNAFYSIIEFSSHIGVHPNTVRRAIKSGLISSIKFGKRGVYRIPISEIERMAVCNMNEVIDKIVEDRIHETDSSR